MTNQELALEILAQVGGEENVNSVTHCATRLRFELKDDKIANKEDLNEMPGVLSVMESGGQFQVIIGTHVDQVYDALIKNSNVKGDSASGDDESKKGVFTYIAAIFTPILPAMVGMGMIKAIMALLVAFGITDTESSTYAVLNAASNGLFSFFPVFVGITASKYFKVNPYIGGAIGAALMDPSFVAIGTEGMADFFGIPMILAPYTSTVFPVMVAIPLYAYLDKFLKKKLPETIQFFMVPTLCLLIIVPIIMLGIGPVMVMLSTLIAKTVEFLLSYSEITKVLTGFVLAGVYPLMVILGIHHGLGPIKMENIANGGDMLDPITAAATFAQMGIAFGVFLKARKGTALKEAAFAGTMSGVLAGVTEPILYGIVLRNKRLLPLLCIAAAFGGVFNALSGIVVHGLMFNSIFTLPAYSPMLQMVIGVSISFVAATILAYLFGGVNKEEVDTEVAERKEELEEQSNGIDGNDLKISVMSPLDGEIVQLKDVNDQAFAQKALGEGVAINPTSNIVKSPVNGTIEAVLPTKHAVVIKGVNGEEVLIHVGLNTTELKGEHFKNFVKLKDEVKVGDNLIEFDIKEISKKGYELTTVIAITNTKDYDEVLPTSTNVVKTEEDTIINIIK